LSLNNPYLLDVAIVKLTDCIHRKTLAQKSAPHK
jgi:hypothetical protein